MAADYALAIGNEDVERLDILNDIYGEISEKYIRHGVFERYRPKTVLEIGCGHGRLLCYWAGLLAGEQGTITGLDCFKEQLQQTEKRVQNEKRFNVDLMEADINTAEIERRFDCVYGRFVLMHQQHKQTYLERVAGLLNPGGAAVFEEPEVSCLFCYPYLPEFYYVNELVLELGKMKEVNYDYGSRLLNDMPAALKVCDIHIEQPVLTDAREKLVVAYSFKQLSADLIRYKLIEPGQAEKTYNKLVQHACAPDSLIGSLKLFQVTATRQ
ncbi:trans-aconitate 2-methyltransferase [Hahella sp. HN01]|uniref:class I SAM-dependent methyltransferase n=1 Tax=Hahella sp. HN01 TaxID=2847262 RepID=UPI001C1F06AF|nr:class I SAM-dependent methyltransferase [Hahella sp. HN01]MBU6955601.1 class I SAM-dependent methyltransferase [Hahella sp. HN01]